MSRTPVKYGLAAFSVVALTLLLLPAGWLGARGRAPNSLQQDPSAVFFTMVIKRGAPVSRKNFLILPSTDTHAGTNSHGKGGGGNSSGGGGGGTTTSCCGGSLSLVPGSSSYAAGLVETPTSTQPEAEEEIAADPNDSSNLVAAISDFSNSSGYNNTKWALSTDGGTTWIENFVPTNSAGYLVTNDATWDANSDPVVAFDRSGNVYLSDLYLSLDSSGRITAEGLYVSAGQFGSIGSSNFTNTYPILTNLHNGKTFNIEDKPWITVDNSSASTAGNVYASWSHFTGCQNQYSALYGGYVLTCSSDSIYLAYSTNHGQTWSTPVQISPGTQDGAVQGSQPSVGPDGTVYLTYEFFGSNNQRQQYLSVGTWSGGSLTFSAPFAVSPVFSELDFAGCSTCTASYRVNSFPNIAVSPAVTGNPAGNVYLVYGAQANSASTAQVNFMACTNNCTDSNAFHGPAILNDVTDGDHFFPVISVNSSGVINTSWFDTRNNPSNPDYLDVYSAFLTYNSSLGTFTVSPNARVTPTTFDASYLDGFGDSSFIGDYIGIAATSGTAHPVWTNVSGILGLPLSGSLQTSSLTLP